MVSSRDPKRSAHRIVVVGAALVVGLLAVPRSSSAQLANPTMVGFLTNFDVRKRQYLNGTQSKPGAGSAAATTQFTMPALPGTYNLRLFANSSYALAATSPSITVMAPTIVLGSDAVGAGGTVTATIANAPGKPGDWIGLYDANGTALEYRQWQYLNGSQSKPAAGATSAVVSFTAPSASGTYNVRLFLAGTFVLLATSPSFSVP